jgi:AcrR family transcriptional regulator
VTERGRATRARLLAATAEVVREYGYARASTRLIAARAGVAEGTIYRHFPHKSELFMAAVMAGEAPVADWIADLPERAGTSTVEANLIDCLRRLATLRDRILPIEAAIAADPELASMRQRVIAGAPSPWPGGPPEAIAAYLTAERDLGRVRDDIDARAAAMLLLAALYGPAMTAASSGEPFDERPLIAAVHVIVVGIAPAPAPGI